jgi:hypothetical protein
MKYSDAEIALVIKLREEGLVGQRLYDRFHDVFPDRTYPAIRSKIEVLRERGMIR